MTINEIAELAGVSRATVSRYLNDGYVSKEKKEKIAKVIEETGYRPSVQAQMLRSKKTSLIGVIIPRIHSESISRMVAGITKVLSGSGYQIILANTFNEEEEELKYLKVFKENYVDGVILIGTILTKKHRKALEEIKVPLVVLGQSIKGMTCVYYDDYNAAKDVTELLLRQFKKRFSFGKIVYLGVTNRDKAAGQARKNGFLDAVREFGITEEQLVIRESGFTFERAYETMEDIFEENSGIRAVFCATDTMALGAMTCVKDHGLEIPEDVIFVGIGDSTMARAIRPKLTTVHYYYKTSGMEAANLLIDMLTKSDSIKKDIKMSYEVIENGTI